MKYSFNITTGDSSISGSLTDTIYRNTQSIYSSSKAYYDNAIITGRHCSNVSLNSQTLLEETPFYTGGKNTDYYYVLTGDYFLVPDNRASFTHYYSNELRIADGISISNTDSLIYDKRDFSSGVSILKTTASTVDSSITGLRLKVAINDPTITSVSLMFTNYNVFFNGQKLVINEYPSNSTTGKIFAIKKRKNTLSLDSDYPDLYGSVLFVENQVDYYINGMEQLESEFLQLYTGVTFIKTGVNCFVDFVSYEENSYAL